MVEDTDNSKKSDNRMVVRRPQYECKVCSYVWMGRRLKSGSDEFSFPRLCPSCHSVFWNRDDVKSMECKRCGHKWTTSGNPERCPKCRTHKWNVDMEICVCNFCGHTWERKCDSTPRACPSCKRSAWNKPTLPHKCTRCGFEYLARYNTLNKCPDCGAPAYHYVCKSCNHRWYSEVYNRQCPECFSLLRTHATSTRRERKDDEGQRDLEERMSAFLENEDNLVMAATQLGIPYSKAQELYKTLQARNCS